MNKNTYIRGLFALAILALFALPLTLQLASRPQETKSKADEGTSLVFDPPSTPGAPIQVKTGDDVTLGMTVKPGAGNVITFVKYVVTYDPDLFDVTADDITPSDSFSEVLEGPTIADGTITGSVSVGSDSQNAVSEPTSVGEIVLHAKSPTGDTPTDVEITSESEALSIGEKDDPTANILTNTDTAHISIAQSGDSQDTSGDTTDPTADDDNTGTGITFSALLHGIGSAGDSVNPKNNSLSNKTPRNKTRPVTVAVLDENGEDISRSKGQLIYDEKTGKFAGSATMDTSIPDGDYTVLIEADGYVPLDVDTTFTNGDDVDLGDVELTAGDIVPDGTLDILDYNTLTDCGYGAGTPLPMTDPKSTFKSEACQKNKNATNTDLDDNGIINSLDFNLFLRELAAQGKSN